MENTLTVTTTPVSGPSHGSVTLNSNGTYTYTPTTGYTGEDTFSYQVCDNGTPSLCSTASVTIDVIPAPTSGNDAPVAVNDNYQGAMNSNVTGNIISNDLDPDGNSLTVSSAQVAAGSDGVVNDALTFGLSTPIYGTNNSSAIVVAGNLTLASNRCIYFCSHTRLYRKCYLHIF